MQYLPALNGSDTIDAQVLQQLQGGAVTSPYYGYLVRALFYNAVKRTVQGLSGAVFRQPPSAEGVPTLYQADLEELTLTRQSLAQVAKDLFVELATVGRVGVLLDMPGEGASKPRPYWVFYTAEQIVNWRTERRGGDQLLTRVVLKETVETPDPDDSYGMKEVVQYREVALEQGVCVISVYQKDEKDQAWRLLSETRPVRRGKPLTFIPFLILGAHYVGPDIDTPPLLDLVDANLDHYRLMADLRHGLHWTALPTPWVAMANTSATMTIGSSQAWNLGPDGKAGMLEFTGAGIKALKDEVIDSQHRMAVLGARLLESAPTAGQREAAETVRLRHSGDGSVLRTMVTTLQQGLQALLRWHLWWAGADDAVVDKVMVGVNQAFLEERLTGQDLQALVLAWQSDAVSWNTLFFNLQRGQVVPPGVTDEQERELIRAAVQQRVLSPDP
ncbi:MAG TPA: DUF4055 domain-containing protein, partial [Gemmatimonadaceae bacterium]|nr:DUF4055 domain-containing protein [Gemmatimonadaceae bacterium]